MVLESRVVNGRYHGKRFRSLLLVVAILSIAYFFGNPETFGAFATTLGALYGTYLAGQSATDWQKAKLNGENQ